VLDNDVTGNVKFELSAVVSLGERMEEKIINANICLLFSARDTWHNVDKFVAIFDMRLKYTHLTLYFYNYTYTSSKRLKKVKEVVLVNRRHTQRLKAVQKISNFLLSFS
jgi:hypothetical protein